MATPTKPKTSELATAENGSGITAGYTDVLMQPEDAVLLTRGGGDLEVYRELLRDEQVMSTFQQRRLAMISKQTIIEPGGKTASDKAAARAFEKQFSLLSWDRIIDRMMYGIMYGYAVSEVLWDIRAGQYWIKDIKVRKQKRFRFGKNRELFLVDKNMIHGERMPDANFWTYTFGADNDDDYYGLGLGHQLYWPVFFKRNGIKFWLIFLEKFGMPTAAGKLPAGISNDKAKRDQVLAALRAIQTDSAVTIPDNVTIDLIEAARSGTADYSELTKRMDQSISKVVLSQTMTTDDGSSRAQAGVHMQVRGEIVQADADILLGSFRDGPLTTWTELNFPGAAVPIIYKKTEEGASQKEQSEIDEKVFALGYRPTKERIKQVYGDGWEPRQDGQQGADTSPSFSEAIDYIVGQKMAHRADQAAIVNAAKEAARDYEGIVGDRIEEMLSYLEETNDLVTFRKHLDAMAAEPPGEKTVDRVHRAGLFARMMGALRAQG